MPTEPIIAPGGVRARVGSASATGAPLRDVAQMWLRVIQESLVRTAFLVVVLALFVGVGVAGASVALLRAVPLYQSSSTLLFSPVLAKGNELAAFSSVGYISARVNAYLVVGRSADFQDAVKAALPGQQTGRLDFAVTAQSDQLMLNVSAIDTDPAKAARAADAFAQRMVLDVGSLNGTASGRTGIRADVVAGPTDARRSVAPNAVAYYSIGVLGGAAIAIAVLIDLRRIQPRRDDGGTPVRPRVT